MEGIKKPREFKACRINERCYLEEFVDGRAIRLVAERRKVPREEWNEAYQEYKRMAELMNADHDKPQG